MFDGLPCVSLPFWLVAQILFTRAPVVYVCDFKGTLQYGPLQCLVKRLIVYKTVSIITGWRILFTSMKIPATPCFDGWIFDPWTIYAHLNWFISATTNPIYSFEFITGIITNSGDYVLK